LIDRALKPEFLRAKLPPQWKPLADDKQFRSRLRRELTKLGPEELVPAKIASVVKRLVLENRTFRAEPPPLPYTPRVLDTPRLESRGPRASIAYDLKEGGPRVAGQWVEPLWGRGRGGIAAGFTAQTVRPESRASLPVIGSGAVGVFHQVAPTVAFFVGAGASAGNSPVKTHVGQTRIATPKNLRSAAVGTLGPVVKVEAQVTPPKCPVVALVDVTAFLPMASTSAFDFAGEKARGQRIVFDTGLQAQVGLTVSGPAIPLGRTPLTLTPFARGTVPITGGGEVSAYVGFELGRSRKGRIPPSQPTLEVSPPPPDANTPTPPAAAPRQPLSHNGSSRPGAGGSAADLGGPITLKTP